MNPPNPRAALDAATVPQLRAEGQRRGPSDRGRSAYPRMKRIEV